MKLQGHISSTVYHYCIPVSEAQWQKLNAHDYLDYVIPRLKKHGVMNIEYNGHFGRNVFFECESLGQAQKIIKALQRIVGP